MIRSVLSVSVLLCCLLLIETRRDVDSEHPSSGLASHTYASGTLPQGECPGAPIHQATMIASQIPGFECEALPDARHKIMVCSAESSSRNAEARQAREGQRSATSRTRIDSSQFLNFVEEDPTGADDQPKSDTPDSSESEEATKPKREAPLSPEKAALRAKIRRALDIYRHSYLNTQQHSPWEIMHSMIAWGVDTKILHSGKPVTAVGWLCFNGRGNGLNLFYLSGDGIAARNGPGLQGHDGQFLAMLAQSRLKKDYPLKVNGKDFTVADLIRYEQKKCRSRTELTFQLIGLMHYLDSEATWKNESGQQWSIPRLISEEISQPIRGATCGGTHRLYSLSYAVKKRIRRGEPVDGEYRRAAKYISDYQAYTFRLQNSDGSFSTEWFRGRGNRNDVERKMQTTGHILELMAYSLQQDKLDSPRMVKAVNFLSSILIKGRQRRWKVGPLGHALHSLVIYDERAFGAQEAQHPAQIAKETAFHLARKHAQQRSSASKQAEPNSELSLPPKGPALTQP